MKNVSLTIHDVQQVKEAAEYLQIHLHQHITIPDLSQVTGIPIKKLKVGFMTVFNQGVHSYHRNLRLEKVKELLFKDKPLKYIAKETGYTDETSLARAFKSSFGTSALVWKRQQQHRSPSVN